MKTLLTLLMISSFLGNSFAQDYEFIVEIIPQLAPPVYTIIRGSEEAVLIDRPKEGEKEPFIHFRADPEFKANGTNYEEIKSQRKYKWDVGDDLLIEDKETQIAKCKTKEATWGKEIKLKVEAKSVIRYGSSNKGRRVSADAEKSVIAPLIKLKAVTFSEGGGGSGFKILDEFEGKSVPLPEYVKTQTPENQSPFGYHSGKRPSYKLGLVALPESMGSLMAKCTEGIFGSDDTSISIVSGGTAEGAVSGKKEIERECKYVSKGEHMSWAFSVFGIKLTRQEAMVSPKYYILLDRGAGGDPWEDLLKVAFDKWEIYGEKDHQGLVSKIRTGIALRGVYNFNYATGKDPNYVTQGTYPHSVKMGAMVSDFLNRTAYLICEESTALLQHSSDVLGAGGCTSRGVSWKGGIGHAYCLFQGKVYDALPGNSGVDCSVAEDEYIKKKYMGEKDVKVENIEFKFTK